MQRRSDDHLTQQELDLLLVPELVSSSEPQGIPTEIEGIREHLAMCAQCREILDSETTAQAQLNRLRAVAPGPHCPSEQKLQQCAAGVLGKEESVQLLQHAATCEHCGPVLKSAAALFSDETTQDEKDAVSQLAASSASWQRELAIRLDKSDYKENARRQRVRFGFRSLIFATATAAIVIIVLIAFRYRTSDQLGKVTSLLNDAYSERRLTDLRLPGALYAPVAKTRGADTTSPPTALLEAEFLIANQLKRRPDDIRWQAAKARAEVVGGKMIESDVENLDGHLSKEVSTEVQLDLANAYFQLAESNNQPSLYGKADNLLKQVIEKTPSDPVAAFNHAIVLERLGFNYEAEKAWLRYLELDKGSKWAEEARSHLSKVQKETQGSSFRSLLTPNEFLAAFHDNPRHGPNTEGFSERYRDLALQSWLEQAFPPAPVSSASTSARKALLALAQLFQEEHRDTWLSDLMAAAARDPQFSRTASLLSQSYREDSAGRFGHVLAFAVRRYPNKSSAVRLEAQWQFLFAERLSMNSHACLGSARTLWDEVSQTSYQWLKVRTLLDYTQCANHSNRLQLAKDLNEQCLHLAFEYRFRDLFLRATKIAADLEAETTGADTAMSHALSGLATFWAGDFSYMSGYNLLTSIDEAAESKELWYFDADVIAEALQLLGDDPDWGMKAVEEHRLARALLLCGDIEGATHNLMEAKKLLKAVPDERGKTAKLAAIEIDLANLDLKQGHAQNALAKLLDVKEQMRHVPDDYLLFEFFVAYGKALGRTGSNSGAEIAFSSALQLAQKGLRDLQDERDRLRWVRHCADAYHEIVLAEFTSNPIVAFETWEFFKGASLESASSLGLPPTAQEHVNLASPWNVERLSSSYPIKSGTSLVSFAVFEDGISAWVYDGRAVHPNWIAVPASKIERLSRHFASDCNDPKTNLSSLKEEGMQLFQILFAPLMGQLSSYNTLLVEPDAALEQVPFSALIDERGDYFGDRFGLVISLGLLYNKATKESVPFSRESHALVVADSSGHPELGLVGIPGVEDEAKAVAAGFFRPRMLVGQRATSSAVLEALPAANIFHFAGHAVLSPEVTGLVLHGQKQGEHSSFLTADSVAKHRFEDLSLVVLSACSSAKGRNGNFSDSESVARALVASGIREVVASAWPVNSAATNVLMDSFYRHLIAGYSSSRALQEAQRELRSTGQFAHPFYWASFSTFGNI